MAESVSAPAVDARFVSIALVDPSPKNPRRTFHGIEELAADVKRRGIDLPLLVRSFGERFEVIAGERRLRAAKKAGLAQVPVIVKELSDQAAREAQLAENLQREDLNPLEEAQAYADLMKDFGQSVPDLAQKFGKSVDTIKHVLRLLSLGEAGRNALLEGKISASLGLLVARIPGAELQARFLKDALHGGEVMSYRNAKAWIEDRYMVGLKDAPFKTSDPDLLPRAGACGPCPKRTGNLPDAGVKDSNRCTDPICFRAKVDALAQLKFKEAEQSGQKVLSKSQVEKVMPHGHLAWDAEYAEISGHQYVGNRQVDVGALLKKHPEIKTVVAQVPESGRVVELVPKKALESVLPKPKKSSSTSTSSSSSSSKAEREAMQKRQAEAQARERLGEKFGRHLVRELVERAEKKPFGKVELAALAQLLVEDRSYNGLDNVICRRSTKEIDMASPKLRKDFEGALPKMSEADLRGVVVELAVSLDDFYRDLYEQRAGPCVGVLQAFGIDTKKEWTEFQKSAVAAPAKGAKK